MNGIQFIPGTKLYLAARARARARASTMHRFGAARSQTLKWDAAKLKGGISAFILYPHAKLGTLFTCLLAAASTFTALGVTTNRHEKERERECGGRSGTHRAFSQTLRCAMKMETDMM